MIKSFKIKNYNLLDNVEIDLIKGFTVISGETGAGKSMMLDALLTLFGKRVEKNKNKVLKKSIIEAVFVLDDSHEDFFITHDLDFFRETILRREININGKSRAFINDTPVLLNVLTQFSKEVVEIHSQHQSILLTDSLFQFRFIDEFSNTKGELIEYQKELSDYNRLKLELKNIKDNDGISLSELDFIKFQLDELQQSNIRIDEKIDLEKQISVLDNAKEISSIILEQKNLLDNEQGILDRLSYMKKGLDSFNVLKDISERLNSVWIELNDITSELSYVKDSIETNHSLLDELNERLNLINNLLQKHGKNSIKELLILQDELENKINSFDSYESNIKEKQKEISDKLNHLYSLANALNIKRKDKIPLIEKKIEASLSKLGISHPRFKVNLTMKESFDLFGNIDISFLFSANKGEPLEEISKVASGGEIARLMLSIKHISAQSSRVNTIIFDEIDTGVSGRIASLMGEMISDISSDIQVIAISHLPQVASKADEHLKVIKIIRDNYTISDVVKLNNEDRVEEVAKLLSGRKLTQAALDNAIELLNQ